MASANFHVRTTLPVKEVVTTDGSLLCTLKIFNLIFSKASLYNSTSIACRIYWRDVNKHGTCKVIINGGGAMMNYKLLHFRCKRKECMCHSYLGFDRFSVVSPGSVLW